MKWTKMEEKALIDGVKKYGEGKWKKILQDPNFSTFLFRRSNVQIKDKWRNMNDRVKEENHITIDLLINDHILTSVALADKNADNLVNPLEHEKKPDTRYKTMIMKALLATKDAKGSEINDIVKFIEERHEVPEDFQRSMRSQLRSLVSQGQLEKVQKRYRIKIRDDVATETPTPKQQRKRPKLWHNLGSVLFQKEALEDEENETRSRKSADSEKESVEEEEVGVLKQAVQVIYGKCKSAITWSPFGSTSRNEY